jgi:tRNA/tmRNA/rRNA uracil-C5-methylase (TrmA/RlmC/RlmD family)
VAAPPLDAKASLLKGDARGGAEPLRGRPGVREEALGRTWRVSGSGFWQVHPAAAETLAGAVVALLRPASGEFALDLYAGVGLFAAALAPALGAGGRVIAVESDERAVADAAHNLADLPMVITEAGRVEAVLTRLGLRRCDLVVLDPPRTGAGADVTRRIAALRPRGVAYVACDPASLARDVATFAECGYRLSALRAFDLFPMTAHVECVALLEPAT